MCIEISKSTEKEHEPVTFFQSLYITSIATLYQVEFLKCQFKTEKINKKREENARNIKITRM